MNTVRPRALRHSALSIVGKALRTSRVTGIWREKREERRQRENKGGGREEKKCEEERE